MISRFLLHRCGVGGAVRRSRIIDEIICMKRNTMHAIEETDQLHIEKALADRGVSLQSSASRSSTYPIEVFSSRSCLQVDKLQFFQPVLCQPFAVTHIDCLTPLPRLKDPMSPTIWHSRRHRTIRMLDPRLAGFQNVISLCLGLPLAFQE